MVYPQYAVSHRIGHSITVSGKHYANSVPDQLFDMAAGITAQQAAQHQPGNAHTKPQPAHAGKDPVNASAGDAGKCGMVQNHTASGEIGATRHQLNSLSQGPRTSTPALGN
jgi:hypothetical protein